MVPTGLRRIGRLNPRKRRAAWPGREQPPGSWAEPPNICKAALGRQHTKRGVTGKLGSVSLEKGHVPAGAIQ